MLNGFTLQKKIDEHQNFVAKVQKYTEIRKKKNKLHQEMADKYRKRVEKFMYDMVETPLVVKSQVNVAGRSQDAGLPNFKLTKWKSEKERIEEAQSYNKMLSAIPISNSVQNHQFRERDIKKEIQPKMRFSNKVEMDTANWKEESSFSLDKKGKSCKVTLQKFDYSLENRKTHFQAVQAIFNQQCKYLLNTQPVRTDMEDVFSHVNEQMQATQYPINAQTFPNSKNPNNAIPTIKVSPVVQSPGRPSPTRIPNLPQNISQNRSSSVPSLPPIVNPLKYQGDDDFPVTTKAHDSLSHLAREVLILCNVNRNKSPTNSKSLKSGNGRVSAGGGRTNHEIYKSIGIIRLTNKRGSYGNISEDQMISTTEPDFS